MFILVPLLLIGISAFGIVFIVSKKLPYVDKLDLLNGNNSDITESSYSLSWKSFLFDLFPELERFFKRSKLREYKDLWLVEVEKFLRKLRVISLRIDRVFESSIGRVRKFYGKSKLSTNPDVYDEDRSDKKSENHTDLKKNEQRLIMEIARNPKDYSLYEKLGDLYFEMGNWTDAKDSLEAAVELNAGSEDIRRKLLSVIEKISENKPA